MSASSSRRASTGSSTSSPFDASWARHSWDPHTLPSTLDLDGRPVWEPPILNCAHLIDSEADVRRREAVMEYTGGDMPRTVQILDTFTELELLDDYLDWATEAHRVADVDDEMESARFFETLRHELHQDLREVQMEDAKDLKHQPMEVDISQWPDSDVRDSVNRPIILRWNYEFKINPDGTWILVDPWDAMVPPCSPVESVKDEEETEGEATFFTASTVESEGENVQQQKAGGEWYEEPDASPYDTDSNALSGPEHSKTWPSVIRPSRTVSSIAAFNTISQRSTTLGLRLELHPSQADTPFSSDLALRLIGLPQARHGDD